MDVFGEEIASLGLKSGFGSLLAQVFGASAAISCVIFYFADFEYALKLIVCLAILFLPPFLLYFYMEYLKDKKQKSIEGALPETLFQIAAFPKNTSMEKIIHCIAMKDCMLGAEFKKAGNLIDAGFPTQDSLLQISQNNSSVLLKRTIAMLLELYETGGELTDCLNEIAQDIFEMHSLQTEMASALSIQKYTLLAGVALFIPLILGLLIGISSSLDLDMQQAIFEMTDNSELIFAINISIQIYLFMLCALSAAFTAMQEGRIKKAPVYFCMLFISSQLVFNLIKSIRFI